MPHQALVNRPETPTPRYEKCTSPRESSHDSNLLRAIVVAFNDESVRLSCHAMMHLEMNDKRLTWRITNSSMWIPANGTVRVGLLTVQGIKTSVGIADIREKRTSPKFRHHRRRCTRMNANKSQSSLLAICLATTRTKRKRERCASRRISSNSDLTVFIHQNNDAITSSHPPTFLLRIEQVGRHQRAAERKHILAEICANTDECRVEGAFESREAGAITDECQMKGAFESRQTERLKKLSIHLNEAAVGDAVEEARIIDHV